MFSYTGHGALHLLHQLIEEVMDWPDVKAIPPFVHDPDSVSIRLEESACTDNASAFISGSIRSGTSQSTNPLSRFAFGLRSLGNRSWLGRTALSWILRIDAGRRRRAVYTARPPLPSGGTLGRRGSSLFA